MFLLFHFAVFYNESEGALMGPTEESVWGLGATFSECLRANDARGARKMSSVDVFVQFWDTFGVTMDAARALLIDCSFVVYIMLGSLFVWSWMPPGHV